MHHTHKFKVYYEDTDAGEVVYHANYLRFAERGRTELLNDLGYSNISLQKDPGVLFVARKASLEFLRPGRLEDALEVRTHVGEMRGSSFTMKQVIYRPKDDTILCEIEVLLVCVGLKDGHTMKPVRLPESIREAFASYLVQ